MKIKSILTVICLAALQLVGYAQDTQSAPPQANVQFASPTNIPLADLGKLWEYALTQVGQVGGQVYGNSVTGNYYAFTPYTNNDADPNMMAAVVRSNNLRFSADVTENLTSYVNYNGRPITLQSGYQVSYELFRGTTNFMLAKQSNGTYAVPTNAFRVQMDMDDWIPFPINGIQSAFIETTDTNGNVTGYYNFADDGRLDSNDGLIFLGREHTGLRGNLYLGFADGSKAAYNLSDGNRHETAVVQVNLDSSAMNNVRSLPDDTKSISFQGGDVIVRVHYTAAAAVSVGFPTGLSQYPVKVCAVDTKVLEQNPFGDGMSFNPVSQPVNFTVQAGQTVLIRFIYPSSGQPLNGSGGYVKGAVEEP